MSLKRGLVKIFQLALLLVASTAMLGQGDNEGYFQLASSHTFGPGDKFWCQPLKDGTDTI